MSDLDISGGQVSLPQIAEALDGAKFGIVVTTQENQNAPWLSYEAGAMSRVINGGVTRVMPMLVDLRISDLTSPLKQFQAARFDKEGVGKLIKSLGEVIELDADQIRNKIEMCWPKLEEALAAIPKPSAPAAKPHRLEADVLDELVANVRALRANFEAFQFFSSAPSSPTGWSKPDFSWRPRTEGVTFTAEQYREQQNLEACVRQAAENLSIMEDRKVLPHLIGADENRITVSVAPGASNDLISAYMTQLRLMIGEGPEIRVVPRNDESA